METINATSRHVKLVPSLFPHRSPTLYFDYPADFPSREQEYTTKQINERKQLWYKTSWTRKCIRDVFHPAQLTQCISKKSTNWICAWTNHLPGEQLRVLKSFQRVNHFPGTWCIGRKDNLLRTLRKARKRRSAPSEGKTINAFDYHPNTYILPQQYDEWSRAAERDKCAVFITKPKNSSNARNIKVITPSKRNMVPRSKPCIIQRYIEDPYLLKKKKFDIPLIIYLYNEGLVRFCSKNYTMNNRSRFTHCCNVSFNKKDSNYVAPSGDVFSENHDKWPLSFLWKTLREKEGLKAVDQLKQTTEDIIVKTIIASEAEVVGKLKDVMRASKNCFEIFGFDILIDNNLKPWILECNISPSLMSSSTLDYRCKTSLFADTMHLIGLVVDFLWGEHKEGTSNSKHFNKARNAWRQGNFSHNAIHMSNISTNDWEFIFDFEDQYARRGNFKILFPARDCEKYLPYFITKRYYTCLLCSWVVNEREHYSGHKWKHQNQHQLHKWRFVQRRLETLS